jgi:hypothetical protein
MVGRVGVEPTTSRLSGVRSNHLSYRPILAALATNLAIGCRGRLGQLRRATRNTRQTAWPASQLRFPEMKGHEDDGMFFGNAEALPMASIGALGTILRKEVIQPQVPLRLPCYDFTPVAKPTVVACLPCGLAQRLRVNPTPMV